MGARERGEAGRLEARLERSQERLEGWRLSWRLEGWRLEKGTSRGGDINVVRALPSGGLV